MSFRQYFLTVLVVMTAVLGISAYAFAQGAPCIPNRFYGDVIVNGKPAPDNMVIVAKINGEEMASTITRDGKYGYSPYVFDVPDNDNNCENTATIEFFVEGQPAGQVAFENGKVTYFKLSATGVKWCGDGVCSNGETCSSCPGDCGACQSPPSGGGGGGGGTYVPPSGSTSKETQCTPEWKCSPWSQCVNGSQTRECTDLNNCSTSEGKPAETQECGIKKILPAECEKDETTCVGKDVWKCTGKNTWERIETCSNECVSGSCSNITAGEANMSEQQNRTETGTPVTGLIPLDRTTLLYAAVAIVAIILVLAYFLSGNRKKSEQKKK